MSSDMPAQSTLSARIWILPIVLVIAALMVLPGGTFLASAGHSAGAHNTSLVTASTSSPISASPSQGSWSASGTQVSPASLASSLPPNLHQTPWVQSLLHQGPQYAPLISYPNLAVLEHASSAVTDAVNPFYVGQPAPMGLADYGLGATTYAYNASDFLGQVTFNSAPNVTDPGSTGVIEPGGASLGYVGNVYEFGLQLNTVATNVTLPGTDLGMLWAQNVVNWNDTGIHFVDDTWNVTAGSGMYMEQDSIYSGCNNGTAGANEILGVYGGVFQCVGGTIPVSAASYPVTVQLYNNLTINAQNRAQLTYGYRIDETGTGTVYTGASDTIVFNNTDSGSWQFPTLPPYQPGFSVNGFSTAPYGLSQDSEIVLVGGIGGDNAVFRSLDANVSLQYSNTSAPGWHDVPSAYDFGGDTGETSTGIAATWTPGHTEELHQGPSMLYGLWNGVPWGSVASGSIELQGSISPDYGFVFVSNTLPVEDLLATGAFRDNMSWLPTNNSGAFDTFLPPLGAPWTTQYYVQAFAAGYAELNGTSVTGTTTGYSLSLTALSNPLAPGALNAPLYAFSNDQALNLYQALTGQSTTPYTFSDLIVNMNFTFNRLNDWGYPSFELFMTQGVTEPVNVNNVYQGTDSPSGNFYVMDYNYPPTGFLEPDPVISGSLPNYTAQINIYGGAGDRVTNQTSFYVSGQGPMVVLWQDTNAVAFNDSSTYSGSGIFVGDSVGTTVQQMQVTDGATGVQDIASSGTTVWNLSANDSLGIEALSSWDGTYSWINVTVDGLGIAAGADFGFGVYYDHYYDLPGTTGLTVNELNSTYGGEGFNLTFSSGTTVNDLSSYDPAPDWYGSSGGWLDGTFGTTFNSIRVYGGQAWGVDMYGAMYTNYTDYVLENSYDYASDWDQSSYTTVNGLTMTNYYLGVYSGFYGGHLQNTVFTNVAITNASDGIVLMDASQTTLANVIASNLMQPNYIPYGWALVLADGSGASVSGVTVSAQAGGVYFDAFTNGTLSGTTSTDGSVGTYVAGSTSVSVQDSTVSDVAVAAVIGGSSMITVSGVTATNATATDLYDAYAMQLLGLPFAPVVSLEDVGLVVSDVTASGYGAAYFDQESIASSVSQVSASSDQYGLVLNGTQNSLFSGINASYDGQGMLFESFGYDAEDNSVTSSTFADDTSYAINFWYGAYYNTVWNNQFINNNGATSTYSAAHIQAFSYDYNNFYECTGICETGVGNYWSDWHTYGPNGLLAPYPVTGATWDEFPIGPAETVSVTFTETGLSHGTKWSVSVNGVVTSGTNSTITVQVPVGTYTYSVAASGYSATPSSGSVTVSGAGQTVAVSFSSTTPLATTSDLNTYFAVALALAIIALLVALLALFWRRKPKPSTSPPPPTAWTPPATSESTTPPPGASGGSGGAGTGGPGTSSWSEGPGGSGSGGSGTA